MHEEAFTFTKEALEDLKETQNDVDEDNEDVVKLFNIVNTIVEGLYKEKAYKLAIGEIANEFANQVAEADIQVNTKHTTSSDAIRKHHAVSNC